MKYLTLFVFLILVTSAVYSTPDSGNSDTDTDDATSYSVNDPESDEVETYGETAYDDHGGFLPFLG